MKFTCQIFRYTVQDVAPLVGARIEIAPYKAYHRRAMSLPSWERGLKYLKNVYDKLQTVSLPSWERGLKFIMSHDLIERFKSLPSWERGLKFVSQKQHRHAPESLPSWERGLKFLDKIDLQTKVRRSPRGSAD